MFFLATFVLVLIIYSKTLHWVVGSWIFNPYYTHGFLVLSVSLYLGYKKSKKIKYGKESSIGILLIAVALIVHTIATIFEFHFISAMTIPFAIFGIVASFYGLNVAKEFLFPVFFILLAVPYPIYAISNVLEVLSANVSVSILKFFGFDVFNVGAEIHLNNYMFVVGAPCSGIRSVLALLTVSVLYTYIIKDDFLIKFILICISIPLAVFANILRITAILVTADVFSKDIALNVVHYFSDVIFFAIAVALLIVIRRCLNWMLNLFS